MNYPHAGFLANYNSLTDKHLIGYFSNTRIKRHLHRSGLISRSGRIISEKEYRLNAMKKDHQKYIRECLAQAIFHKVLDMERHHQVEIKRKLENSVRKERVQRIKVEQPRRSAEDSNLLLSPHPPTAPRNRFRRRKLGDRGQTGHVATQTRPSTAPGNIQHPVRLQPLYSYATTDSTPKSPSSSRPKMSALEKEHYVFNGGEKGSLRPIYSVDYSAGMSPYQLPIINNYMIPVPFPPPKNEKNINIMKLAMSRGRRFRSTTAPNTVEQLLMKDPGKLYKPQVQSNAQLTMIYLGKTVHLTHDLLYYRDEIKIYQQHCGGENVCVYKGKLMEGETFQFISKRHYGFPFSLTFYLNGIQVDRLSSCCEYKHRKGARLGGKHGHFGFVNVERSSPCYRCIISMGLDKKPYPPKKNMDDEEEKKDGSGNKEANDKNSSSGEKNKDLLSLTSALDRERKYADASAELEVQARKVKTKGRADESEEKRRCEADDGVLWSDSHERESWKTFKWKPGLNFAAYDEDFEAYEETSDKKVNEQGQKDDQMDGMSKSPSDDIKYNLGHEKGSKTLSLKTLQTSNSEQDESDAYLESDVEEKQGRKPASSLSSSSTMCSSEKDFDSETTKHGDDNDNTDIHSEYENESTEHQREEGRDTEVEEEDDLWEAKTTKAKKRPDTLHENKMETNLQDMTISIRKKAKHIGSVVDMNTSEDREETVIVPLEGSSQEAELSEAEDRGDCKSVQEKIAEAIENDQLLSSEPEPSDSSTEDEEENFVAAQDQNEVPDGASLAEELRLFESQEAAEQVEQEKQMAGKEGMFEEEELVAEEGPEEAALEAFPSRVYAGLAVEQAIKNEFVTEKIDLRKAAIPELDLTVNSVEKEATFEEEKSSEGNINVGNEVKEQEETILEDAVFMGEDLLGRCRSDGEEVEDQNFTEVLMATEEASQKEEGTEEIVEVDDIWKTVELMGKKVAVEEEEEEGEGEEEEVHETKEVMEEAFEVNETLGTTSVERNALGEAEAGYEGNKTFWEEEQEAEDIENETRENTFLNGDEWSEDGKHVQIELSNASIKDAKPAALESTYAETVSINEKADTSDELLVGGNSLLGELSFEEEFVQKMSYKQEEKLEETSPEVSEMKSAFVEEDPTLERLELWLEGPLLDEETEGDISITENECENDQEPLVTTEEEEPKPKPSTEGEEEGEASLNGILAVEEAPQEEEDPVQVVKEKETEEMLASEDAISETKQVIEKKEPFTEEAQKHDPEYTLIAEEIKAEAEVEEDSEGPVEERELVVQGEMEAEEPEACGEVVVVPLDTEPEGEEIVSDVAIVGGQSTTDVIGEVTAEEEQTSESLAQNVSFVGGMNPERSMENEAIASEEGEKTPKETTVRETSNDLQMHQEVVIADEENEAEDVDTGGEMTLEGILSMEDMQEVLLFGLQKLISEVSQMNVEDITNGPDTDVFAEEASSYADSVKEDRFADIVVAQENQNAWSGIPGERGIEETVEEIHLEREDGRKISKTGEREAPVENLPAPETIPLNAQQSEKEQRKIPAAAAGLEDRIHQE